MKSYVIDASVVSKCFIAEDYSDKALEAINSHVEGHILLSAPSLIIYELGNVFWKHPNILPERLYEFIDKFLDLQICLVNVWSVAELLRKVCIMSKTRNVTFYDASYLTLAEEYKTKLVTADENLHNKAPDIVVLLKEFKD